MPTPIENTPQISPTLDEERMKNILLLLEHLFEREDVTVKLVLEYLYDVGSVRLIDKNIHIGCLNQSLKSVARMSKPMFKIVGLYWFQRNCPKLITDWLYSLVIFEEEIPIDNSQLELQRKEQEIKRLRTRERLLAAVSIGAIAAVGWLGYQLQIERSQLEPATFRSASGQLDLIK
jgi:hypothetical protein